MIFFGVLRIGRGGSLAIFQRRVIDLHMETSSSKYIDVIIYEGREDSWRFTNFYGRPETHLWHESWDYLRRLHSLVNKFMWHKHYPNGVTMWERLDRALCTNDWISMFPASKVTILECGTSDHNLHIIHPLLIPTRKQKPWWFEQVWLED